MLSIHSRLGEEFQKFIDAWDEYCEEDNKLNQINMLVDGQSFVMFFRYNGDIYAATEPNRVVFARMKHPDDGETPPQWLEDANFMAVNLTKTILGSPTQQMFKSKDIDQIEIVPDKEDVIAILAQQVTTMPAASVAAGMQSVIQLIKPKQK